MHGGNSPLLGAPVAALAGPEPLPPWQRTSLPPFLDPAMPSETRRSSVDGWSPYLTPVRLNPGSALA